MADLFPPPLGFNGINLDNYFPNQRSYNSVVYVHKRFLANPEEFEKEVKKDIKRKVSKRNETKKERCDKGIQFDGVIHNEHANKRTRTYVKTDNDSFLNQTVQFAKKLVPLIIPPKNENFNDPIYYTIKTKKPKKKQQDYTIDKNFTYDKNKVLKNSSHRKHKVTSHMESLSIKGSVSHSSENTLDDFHINDTLTCTISEISEKKYLKKERDSSKHKKSHSKKITVSNSFEALATETLEANEGGNIKIRLMNETDKNIFNESLQIPIINAIKECIIELNHHSTIDSGLKEVQRYIKCNNEKLDHIVDKITCIERRIESQVNKQIEIIQAPQVVASKSSKLEQLGEDLEEYKDSASEDEYSEVVETKKTYKCKSVIASLDQNKGRDEKKRTKGGGKLSSPLKAMTEVSMKSDRLNKIPTRFCWTDAGRT